MGILPLCNTEDIEELNVGEQGVPRQTNNIRIERSTLFCIVLSVALNLMLGFRDAGQLQGTGIQHPEQSALKRRCLGARSVLLGQWR